MMKLKKLSIGAFAAISLTILLTLPCSGVGDDSTRLVEIESGTASFRVPTNMPGLQVDGKSHALRGRVVVLRSESGFLLQQIEASIPVKSLVTGISVRDEHMRKQIFA